LQAAYRILHKSKGLERFRLTADVHPTWPKTTEHLEHLVFQMLITAMAGQIANKHRHLRRQGILRLLGRQIGGTKGAFRLSSDSFSIECAFVAIGRRIVFVKTFSTDVLTLRTLAFKCKSEVEKLAIVNSTNISNSVAWNTFRNTGDNFDLGNVSLISNQLWKDLPLSTTPAPDNSGPGELSALPVAPWPWS
jgi:hypothetical protein